MSITAIYIVIAACMLTALQKSITSFFTESVLHYQLVSLLVVNFVSLNIFSAYCPKGKSSINVYLQGELAFHQPCFTKVDLAILLIKLLFSILMTLISFVMTKEVYLDSFDPLEYLIIINIVLFTSYLVIVPPQRKVMEVKVYDLEANQQNNYSVKITGSVCQCGCAYYADFYKPDILQ